MAASPYQLVAGHNNAGSLVAINAILDANSIALAPPRGLPTDGLISLGPNGTSRLRKYPSIVLVLPMLLAQHKKIQDTYVGAVTLRASLNGGISFANYNAIGNRLPSLADLDSQRIDVGILIGLDVGVGFAGVGFNNVAWTFTRLEAI